MTTQPEQRDARDVVREYLDSQLLWADADFAQARNTFQFLGGVPREVVSAIRTLVSPIHGAEPTAWMIPRRYGSGLSFVKPETYYDYDESETVEPVPLFRAPPPDERDAEIARLTAELETLREEYRITADAFNASCEGTSIDGSEDVHDLRALVRSLTAERDEARAQCDAFKADAERYRWLRDNQDHEDCPYYEAGIWYRNYLSGPDHMMGAGVATERFDSLDTAIDAAIDAVRGKGSDIVPPP